MEGSQTMRMNDSDFWKMCALLGIVCASISAFTYVMAGVVVEVIRPAIAAMVAS